MSSSVAECRDVNGTALHVGDGITAIGGHSQSKRIILAIGKTTAILVTPQGKPLSLTQDAIARYWKKCSFSARDTDEFACKPKGQ